MSTATKLLTADDLWNLPDHGGHNELVRGELRPMSPAGFDHGAVTINLAAPLSVYVKSNRLGTIVAAETGFVIARDPDTVRAPDIAFVAKSRLPASGRPIKFWVGAPDLAVETMSPWDTVFEVDEKVQEWIAAGTRMVWVINPRQKTVQVLRSNSAVRVLSVNDRLDGEEVVPGFSIAVAELFE